jgi:hypothetical protein
MSMAIRNQSILVISSILLLCAAGSCSSRVKHNLEIRHREERAGQRIREIMAAEVEYKKNQGVYAALSELGAAGLVADSLADGMHDGYKFEVKASAQAYQVVAFPLERSEYYQYVGEAFYTDETGVIRGIPFGKATDYLMPSRENPAIAYQ